jgi:hypothetical protein
MSSRLRRHRPLWVVAALSLVGALVSWSGLERRDDGWLLTWAGRPLDLHGTLSSRWLAWQRDCRDVQSLSPLDEAWAAVGQHVADYSPPDSASVTLLAVQRQGPWWVVQATFTTLEPVVVVLKGATPESLILQPLGVWSGPTAPWDPAWRIRRFLGHRLPDLPASLLSCLEPAAPWKPRAAGQ